MNKGAFDPYDPVRIKKGVMILASQIRILFFSLALVVFVVLMSTVGGTLVDRFIRSFPVLALILGSFEFLGLRILLVGFELISYKKPKKNSDEWKRWVLQMNALIGRAFRNLVLATIASALVFSSYIGAWSVIIPTLCALAPLLLMRILPPPSGMDG